MLISKMVAAVFGITRDRIDSVRNGENGELHPLRFTPRIAPCFPYDRYMRPSAIAARCVARTCVAAPVPGRKAVGRARNARH
ncbi:Response regulator [Burkholderia cenocepacia PC184]|nr:Response regulator [Burkholderia cenocepacia PC184]